MRDINKVRKLATAAAVSLVLASGGVRALGLGDIEMRSALNQPMNAEIRLTSVQPGEADGMIVKLASPDAFQRAGIERTTALTDLRFSVDQSSGTPVIKISSSRPVVEPFLNFLLEVDWPAGRMVREYTVLLDPPVFMTPSASDRNTASEQPAILQRNDTSLITPTPIERTDADGGFEVEIVGSSVEIADNAVLPQDLSGSTVASTGEAVSLDGGEVVSLDGLGASALGSVELIEDSSAVSLEEFNGESFSGEGEVVSLTDIEVANPDAAAQFQADQVASSDFDFNVEIVGSSSEVSDTFVVDGQSSTSEIVSLDSLDTGSVGAGGGEVTVQRGDTLLAIAESNAVAGVSAQQMMMALLNANQGAFINGNVNLVKAGAILRIPESDELTQLSQAQAVAQLGEQNQLWREYRDNIRGSSGTRVAATTRTPPAQEPSDQAQTEISDAAQRILDAAKEEALGTKELNIVAQNDSTTTSASATADNTDASADAQLGAINKKLQLAKEELASTRLETTDLDEQSAELKSTTENIESLVNIRQQEVARLQEQLAQAGDSDAAGTSAADLLSNAQNAVAEGGSNASQELQDAANGVVDSGENALTAAGEQLGEVELVPETNTAAAVEPAVQQAPPAPWYLELLQKYGKWLVIGIGGLCALLAGLLLLGKRRNKDEDMLDVGDDVEFLDDEDGVQLHAEGDFGEVESAGGSGIGSAVATGVAGAAAVGGAAAVATGAAKADDADDTEALTASMDAMEQPNIQEGLDPDDTISEVDVYLAYGLHGQAEELLAKAIDRDPNNPEYAYKLLQTQHAQGNADAFAEGAASYHERFGGDDAPDWDSVSQMGYDIQPNNILFASSETAVESIGKGGVDAPTLGSEDFASLDGASGIEGSVSRDFGDASEAAADVDESNLMDQSLDPAFAFDETDLEATGDFSQIASEIADEEVSVGGDTLVDDTSLDFPGFEDAADSVGDAASAGKDAISGGAGALAGGAAAVAGGIGAAALSAKNKAGDVFDDALSLDDLESAGVAANDGAGSVAEDLTLDLDQLSGDLELDGTDLMDQGTAAVDDLEMPDLTSDNSIDTSNVANIDGSDEMDTMMDLAKAYIDMGDKDSASSALGEIVKSGNPAQVSEAETLLRKIS